MAIKKAGDRDLIGSAPGTENRLHGYSDDIVCLDDGRSTSRAGTSVPLQSTARWAHHTIFGEPPSHHYVIDRPGAYSLQNLRESQDSSAPDARRLGDSSRDRLLSFDQRVPAHSLDPIGNAGFGHCVRIDHERSDDSFA